MISGIKNALLTVNIGNYLGGNSRSSFLAAAKRWDCEYVEIYKSRSGIHPWATKLMAFELCDAERICLVDADMVISSSCPNPFLMYPPDAFVAVSNQQDHMPEGTLRACADIISQDLKKIGDQFELIWNYPSLFINSGFWVASRPHHANMLTIAKNISILMYGATAWKDQSALNWALVRTGTPILKAPDDWNFQFPPDTGDAPMEKFIYHWAGIENKSESVNWRKQSEIMNYQPLRINGADTVDSERDCAERYAVIRKFCEQYKRPFTVLDIGAAQGYFGIRLCEDFPDCTVVCLEREPLNGHLVDCFIEGDGYQDPKFIAYRERQKQTQYGHLPDRMIWLQHKFILDELRGLAHCEHFDVVLGMSVVHHFEGTFAERLEVFRLLGDNLILELAWEPNACGGKQKEHEIPLDAFVIGEGKSHLIEGATRKILLLSKMKTGTRRAYVGSENELNMTIYSDFFTKSVKFHNKKESRDWHRGINLKSFLSYGGVWPTRKEISRQLEAIRQDTLKRGHGDIVAHNVILQGNGCVFVDVHGPMDMVFSDEEYYDKLLAGLRT